MPGCGSCGKAFELDVAATVGRRDTCPHCEAELRTCLSCRHYEPNVAKGCKEPFAEVPRERDRANFCEFFQIGEGRVGADLTKNALASAAESLFKKR
jgi:hypothetical protein